MRRGNLDKRAEAVVALARELSVIYAAQTGTEHLLLALLRAPDTRTYKILTENGLTYSAVERRVYERSCPKPGGGMTPELKRSLRAAAKEAREANSAASPEYLLLNLLRLGNICKLLIDCGADPNQLFTATYNAICEPEPKIQGKKDVNLKLIEQFARDMTERAAMGDPVIGRDRELEELIQILCRKNKNNPALIGEPGVGKTAIVEELARRMAAGRIPSQLVGKRLMSLDMASLVAGTKYRGEFEERVRDLLVEIRKAGNIVLFVDEMHTLIGAGSAEGAIDAANIVKPALGRGELQMIGATTCKEYRKYIEKDAALERRFRVIQVEEPTAEQTAEILRGLRPGLELYHQVRISDEAIHAAVEFSSRYLSDRFLPDKALDLLDESAACCAVSRGEIRNAKSVTRQTVAQTIALRTGIPAGKISQQERSGLMDLEQRLQSAVVGQEQAVRMAAAAVRRGRSGLADKNRPLATLLFAGPTGVGKTALCKALAREVYGSEQSMVRLDMSEYMEKHAVSRLIGAPPGYVGHGEGGELTEKIRKRPYSLLLLDELEKAHRDVLGILLQIMEDGILTDALGRTVNFKNTLIVMTTNAGSALDSKCAIGFAGGEENSLLMKHLREYFSPEFLGRIDAVAAFRPLREPQLRDIAGKALRQTVLRAKQVGVELAVAQDAAACISAKCAQLPGGAREIRHLVQTMVENPLADMILQNPQTAELRAELVCRDNGLALCPAAAMPV